jgi:hypothetical protein
MAYFIFLKYLRSLEEFRKNPHVKIPPKSPCANFQSPGILKNQILFGNEFSSLSVQPAQQSAGPSELSVLLTSRPNIRLLAPHRTGRAPPPACAAAAPETPCPPPLVQDPPPSTIKPQPLPSLNQSFTTLKSPFTPPPISPLMPAIIVARHPPRAPRKGEPPPRSTLHHSPSPSPPLPHQNTPPTELRRHHHFTLVARPLRRSSSSGEPRGESPIPPFPFPVAVGEHRQAGAPSRSLSGGFPVRSAMWVHLGPARSCGPRSVDRVHGFFHCEINQKSQNSIFLAFLQRSP